MALQKFKAIFFDVGNTLLLPHPSVEEVCAEILKSHGIDVSLMELKTALNVADKAYEERYWADDSFWMNEVETSRFWVGLYQLMLDELGVNGEKQQLATEIYERFGEAQNWQPYPDVLPTLKKLREAGFIIGLISNWDTRLTSLAIEIGLSPYLDFVISSANVGLLKPQPQIFNLALKRAGVKAQESLHVGDHYYADIMGARTVGITPVLLDRKGEIKKADCLVINNLFELIDYLWSN